jgi:predicted GNAT family acetyltransferase
VLTTREGVHVLAPSDLTEFLALAGADPVVNVFVDYRARTTRLDRRWLGGEVWGRFVGGRLVSACHVGANLVPVQAGPDDVVAFAERARGPRRGVASIVGPQQAVEALWAGLADSWGTPRELRLGQPHLQIDGPPAIAPDPGVRRTTMAEFDVVYPACVDFYTEELGISPEYGGGGSFYRARVQQLISKGWQFARIEDGRVLFKAEVGCVSPYAAQVQGVYVDPERRGEGLSVAGMAAVVQLVRQRIAPTVSLYVNEWNTAARAAYARVGFEQTATFATLMF